MTKTWVVTGASGFLGYNMCKFLLNKRVKVKGVDLSPFEYDDLKDVEFYQGDIRDSQLMHEICRGADVVMHGAAALPRWPRDKIWDVNLRGTKTMLDAASSAGVPRFIFISTTAVYGIPKKHPIYEKDPLPGVGPYGDSKVAAEKACREYNNMTISILRPKTFVGKVRLGVFSVLFDWLYRGKKLPVIGNGENRYQLLGVDDLVEAIYLMSKLPKKKANDVYNVGATKFDTINSHMQTLLDYRGRGKLVHFPARPVKFALRVLDKLKLSPLYQWAYDTLDKDHFVSVDKLVKQGWKPKMTSEQALLQSYKWYEKHRDEIVNRKGVTHTTQWDQGVLSWIRDLFF